MFPKWFYGLPRYQKTVSQLNNLQMNELRQISVAICGRQCAVDCRIVVKIPTHRKPVCVCVCETHITIELIHTSTNDYVLERQS
jgi:hypothetical protein